MAYTLPQTDPSLPSQPSPVFSDTTAARGDHLRVNNSYIWQNLTALAALFSTEGYALDSVKAGGLNIVTTAAPNSILSLDANGKLPANAATASLLETPRKINGITFSGGADIELENVVQVSSATYTIASDNTATRFEVDTTSNDVAITLPAISSAAVKEFTIAFIKGANAVTISPNAANANTISSDALASIGLYKKGDYIRFRYSALSGYWEIVDERITANFGLDTYAGYGDTSNSKIMRFTNQLYSKGAGVLFTENHSSGYSSNTKGLEITFLRSGRWTVTYICDAAENYPAYFGLSLNSNQLSTAINSITKEHLLGIFGTPSALASYYISRSHVLTRDIDVVKNDVLRPHNSGAPTVPTWPGLTRFFLTYRN